MSEEKPPTPQAPEALPARAIAGALLCSLGVAGLSVAIVAGMLVGQRGTISDTAPEAHPEVVGGVEQGLIELSQRGTKKNEKARTALHSYAWRDRDAGVVAIPIERAFDLILAQPAAYPGPQRPLPGGDGGTDAGTLEGTHTP